MTRSPERRRLRSSHASSYDTLRNQSERFMPRDTSSDGVGQPLARIGVVDVGPTLPEKKKCGCGGECQERQNHTEDHPRGEGFFFRDARRLVDVQNRNVFRFLNARHFVLLCKKFKDRLLHLHTPVEICISHGKSRQLAQWRIELTSRLLR